MTRSLFASAAMAALLVTGAAAAEQQQTQPQPDQARTQQTQQKQQKQDKPVQGQQQAKTPQQEQSRALDQVALKDLIGMTVKAKGGEDVGEVGAVVRDGPDSIQALIIDQGGFVGIGEEQRVLERGRVAKVTQDGILVDIPKEQMAQLPRYKVEQAQDRRQEQQAEATAGSAEAGRQHMGAREDVAQQQNQGAARAGGHQTVGSLDQQTAAAYPATANDLIGKDAYSATNEDVGDVSDVLVDDQGKPVAVIIDHGGWLGLGEKQIAIDWNQLTVTPEGVRVKMPSEQISQLPEYEGDIQ